MILKGQKRKLPLEDELVSDRESQRQFVFSVSLNKYQQSQDLPEPSLRRAVLIANTLRQVSLEAPAAPPAGESPSKRRAEEEEERQEPENVPEEDWGAGSAESDFSLSVAISSILNVLDSATDWAPQAVPRAPLRALENLSEVEHQAPCPDVTMEDPFQVLERDVGGLRCPPEDELLHYLPSFSSFAPPPPSSHASYSAPAKEVFELDQLMEILVES